MVILPAVAAVRSIPAVTAPSAIAVKSGCAERSAVWHRSDRLRRIHLYTFRFPAVIVLRIIRVHLIFVKRFERSVRVIVGRAGFSRIIIIAAIAIPFPLRRGFIITIKVVFTAIVVFVIVHVYLSSRTLRFRQGFICFLGLILYFKP
ncbi:hypothetical protein D3C73_915560 [compost metagenome]